LKELHRLLEYNLDRLHISRPDLEEVLPPPISTWSLNNRLSQVRNHWDLPFPPHDSRPRLCNSAKLLNSGRNTGKLEHAPLRPEDKQVIKREGGNVQFWKCENCSFRVRYHATHANSPGIETTNENRKPGKGYITLRSVFLAKSHLHMRQDQLLKYACLFCIGSGKSLTRDSSVFAKEETLADHIGKCHDIRSLPRPFMERLFVAAPDEIPEGRCDIQFHRTRSALQTFY
jgi:hypothetical protein